MQENHLDVETFVVLGEGLAAGAGHFSLSEETQVGSFPALLAEKLGTAFRQPLIENPGLGNVGFQPQPAILPDLLQTTVAKDFPPEEADLGNLAIPGFSVADALRRRPTVPLVQTDDPKQTLTNLILGLPGLLGKGKGELPTQVEYAKARKPSFVLVALGYQEVLEPLVAGHVHAGERADLEHFAEHYGEILKTFADKKTTVVAATIPNPVDTAYFSDLETAAKILRTEADFLEDRYGLDSGDRLSVEGLVEVGYELLARQVSGKVPEGMVLSAEQAEKASLGVDKLNAQIRAAAEEHGALVFDLHGYLHRIAKDGVEVAGKKLTAEYLGGFYLLNGVYPGLTGHALIANELIGFLNAHTNRKIETVDVEEVMADDANTQAKLAPGPTYTDEFLVPLEPSDLPDLPPPDPSLVNVPPPFDPAKFNLFPIQTTYPYPPFDFGGQKAAAGCEPAVGVPAGGLSDPHLENPLELPPGLEQTLEINVEGSYFGDALRAVDAPDERPFLPGLPTFGASGNTFFGGLAMTDSRLRGRLHVRFSEPDEAGKTRFEITHPGGLDGEDSVLAAPKFFKLPGQLQQVLDAPGIVSSGELDLTTGVVTNFRYAVVFRNTPTQTLFGVNPNLPAGPLVFPGPPNAGSTWIRFEQRPDGKLDVTLAANLFLPLGKEWGGEPVRFPLPFGNPRLQCASILNRGLALHPHIHLTTRDDLGEKLDEPLDLPVNTVREFTPFTHNNNFGDVFDLAIDELDGAGTGRSHLLGRIKVQFGPRFGDAVPINVNFLPPGGLLSEDPVPLPYLPPGTSRGQVGFNEQLEFPSGVVYHQTELSSSMDPLNTPLGAVHLETGHILDELLCRCFVVQELFVNLSQVEPCTPADSFLYQGPARIERGVGGQLVFSLDGEVFIPYPRGFDFPSPAKNGRPAYRVREESRLDPFLRLQAMEGGDGARNVFSSGEKAIEETSSIGQKFSYAYKISADPSKAEEAHFEYTNHDESATFELERLSWVRATRSREAAVGPASADVVTFGGFGSWSQDDDLHQVSVQISLAEGEPYVGIQVDGGTTSNVNTKPPKIEDTIPF